MSITLISEALFLAIVPEQHNPIVTILFFMSLFLIIEYKNRQKTLVKNQPMLIRCSFCFFLTFGRKLAIL